MIRTANLGLMLVALSLSGAAAAETAALTVSLDRSARINLRAPITSIIVANPRVADVTVTDATTLFITGKGYGTTEIIATDAAGRTVLQTQVVVTGNDQGTVRLWRGGQVTDVACGTSCAPAQRGTPVAQ